MSDLQKQFEKLSLELSQSQKSLNELISARSHLETQFQENKMVLDEFAFLNEDSKIFKLNGPVLMPQDYNESKLNVEKRIEYIQDEIKRVEAKIADGQKKMESTTKDLVQVRTKLSS